MGPFAFAGGIGDHEGISGGCHLSWVGDHIALSIEDWI